MVGFADPGGNRDDIDKTLLELVEDVLLNRRDDATERLVEHADSLKGITKEKTEKDEAWRKGTVEERLSYALVKGIVEYIDADTEVSVLKLISLIGGGFLTAYYRSSYLFPKFA